MPGIFATELANTITDDAVMETLKQLDMATVARPAAEVAESIKFSLEQNQGLSINEITLRPTQQEIWQTILPWRAVCIEIMKIER